MQNINKNKNRISPIFPIKGKADLMQSVQYVSFNVLIQIKKRFWN